MEYFLHFSPLLQKSIAFIEKYSRIAKVTPSTISTPTIQIRLPTFCNFSASMDISDLLELAKADARILINEKNLTYTFTVLSPSSTAQVTRTIKLCELECDVISKSPHSSIKIPKFNVLGENYTILLFKNSILNVENHGYLKIGMSVPVELLEGATEFSCKVLGKDLSIINDLEGELVINYYGSHIVLYNLEEDSEVAVLINAIN
ncbi:hypothetical protein PAEPH01_0027 [Pancytospora epiphaga]|nr:hypothetical protein PAEPH01_0027 [Pancytospora epiphaga]